MERHILFSAGKDSLLTLYRLVKEQPILHYIHLGHRAAAKELASAEYYAEKFGLKLFVDYLHINLPEAMLRPDGTDNHVPLRNALLLSFLVNKYYTTGKAIWYMGMPKDSATGDSDQDYAVMLDRVVNGPYAHLRVKTVIGRLRADSVMDHLLRIPDVDISHLWLCDNDGIDTGGKMCGYCYKCTKSLAVFKIRPYFHKIKDLYYAH